MPLERILYLNTPPYLSKVTKYLAAIDNGKVIYISNDFADHDNDDFEVTSLSWAEG